MLGHLDPAAGDHEGDRGGDVEGMQPIAAGAADIDDLMRMFEGQGRLAHLARAGGQLAQRLAAHPHGGQGGGDLGRCRLATQAGGEEVGGVGFGQGRAVGQPRQQRLEGVRHVAQT